MENEDLIKLATYEKKRDAEFAKSVLEENGIESVLKGEDIYGLGDSNIGLYYLYVYKEDYQAAKEVIESINNPPEELGIPDMEIPGSESQKAIGKSLAAYIAVTFLFFGFMAGVKFSDKIKGLFSERNSRKVYDLKRDKNEKNLSNDAKRTIEDENYDKEFDEKMKEPLLFNDEIYQAIVEKDFNSNGVSETFIYYQNNDIEKVEVDINEDKKPDIISSYVNGIIDRTEVYDKKTRKLKAAVEYKSGIKSREFIDTNEDGVFDKEIIYDEYGCFKKIENITESKR